MNMHLLKSLLHNIGVVIVGIGFGYLGVLLDGLFGLESFRSPVSITVGSVLVLMGFLVRVWATYYFYRHQMKVISLAPQTTLLIGGPYRFSRNPLYLGGNVFVFLGTTLFFGSLAGIMLTVLNVLLVDRMIRREERQLENTFGDEWTAYTKRVRRWL